MQTTLLITDPDDPMALFCLSEYFALLARRVPGVTPSMFTLPDPDAATYRPPRGTFLVAVADGAPLGCVSLRPLIATTAEVKRLWIAPAARGQGLARRMMQSIEDQARALGYAHLHLDTNENLPEAIALYAKTGWRPIPAYSPPPATHWFAKSL